jgi:hypothetical protein
MSIAVVWIATALISVLYPVADSLALLARVGLAGTAAIAALYGAAALDLAIGLAILAVRRRWVWTVQVALIVAYTAVITAFLPEVWLHPFGPVLKNLPLLAAVLLVREAEPR